MRWRWPAAALAVNKPAVLFFTMGGIRALMGPPPRSRTGAAMRSTASAASATSRPCCRPASSLARRFIVCEMGLRSLDIDRASLRTDVPFTIAGIVTLLEETKPGMHLLTL